jgi:hypothetical protein
MLKSGHNHVDPPPTSLVSFAWLTKIDFASENNPLCEQNLTDSAYQH